MVLPQIPSPSKSRAHCRSGFTLIELLVVIFIIAVLAGLLIPAISMGLERANSTKCVSNLRGIGSAIAAYSADNDGYLPGPLSQGQTGLYKEGDSTVNAGQLSSLLRKYIQVPDLAQSTKGTESAANAMICPSWQRDRKKAGSTGQQVPCYVVNFAAKNGNQVPFGELGSSEPMKAASLASWDSDGTTTSTTQPLSIAQTWALKDADQKAFLPPAPTPANAGQLPLKPVHGDTRNALFYDWHVGKLDLNDQPK